MTSMRDSAKAELQSLQDELSVLMHQQQTNAEFTLSQLAQTQRANDTLRDSLKSANKGHESIQRRSVALQAKAEEVNSKLTERNTELQMIIDELLKKNALDISTRDGRIEQLEAALKELDSSRSAMTESQVRQLESEIARLKARLSQDEKTHAETVAAAKTTRATLRWAALYSKKTHADRRNRLFTVARDFGRSLRIEYDSHVKNANDIVKSVHGSRGELEESLSQLTSRLSEAKSQRATERWVRLIRSMHAQNRHGRFFTQAQDFVGSLKLEIREAEAGKFRNAIALSARDNRIKALEEMVNEYQSSLHETKTKYSHALESENEQLRQDFASARHDKVLAHWVVLAKSLRVKQRRERLLNVAKDFAGSLKTELRLHGEVSTRTLHSLQDTIAKLKDDLNASAAAHKLSEEEVAKLKKQLADLDKMKKDLDASRGSKKTVEDELQALKRQLLEVQQTQDASVDELNKALANAASEAKSQRATERWVRLIRSMHARNRHGRFFTQAQDFVGSLKLEIREAEAGKFRNAIALSARDNRIKALEEMVNEYQSSLHETKTKYSHALESENEQLRQDFASARHDKVLAHWVVLAKSLRVKQRRERLLNVAKDFAGSLKTELRLHGEVSTRTLHSLQDTIAKLKDDKKSVQDELNALKKGRDDALRKVKQELDNERKQAAKKASELQKTIDSLNDELSTLRQKLETDATKSSSLKKSAEARIAELESIIAGMEEGMRELEKSAEETRLRLEESEKKLTAERATLRRQLEEITKSHEALKESSVAARAHINWRWIVNKLRQRERHERTVDQAKAFSRALYADYQFHVAFSNKTIGSLNDTLKTWQTRYDEACARESALRDEMLGLSKDAAAKDASRLETIESLEQKVALVDQQRKTLQEQLNSHDREAKKRYDDASRAAKKEADALRERIRDLEKKLANEESSAARNVDKLNGQIEKLKSQLDKSKLNEQRKQRIVELEAQVQNLESAVAELEKALTAARHTHKDDSDAKNERIKELEHECGRLQTSMREYESTLESTRTASSGQTQRLHAEVRILREQLDELAAAHDKTLASRKSERALLRWAWMCRVLRSKNMHVRHLHLVKSFTSAELVESRNWAKTCDKTIHSLNDQLQDAKTKLKDLDAMHEKARDQDARIAELELMLQEQQSLSETTQSASSGEIDRLRERNAALVEELDKLRADALSDKAAAEAKIIELKAQYEKQLDELRQKIREDSENAAEQERLAKVEHQSQLDDMAARLAEKSKMNSTFAEARYQQMKDDYERQLDDMRKRMQTDTGSFDERMSQAQKDFEHQLADLKDVQKKELAVLKFRHGSALGLRDKRIHELENLLVEAQNEWEQLRSSTSSDGVKLKRELAEARVRIGELEAAQDHDDSDARISALQSSIQELRDTVVKLETEKIGLADENDKLRAEIESLKVASSRSDALQSRIGASDQALSDATARAKSERALLRWAWMCRVLRSKNMHVRHLHLVKSFTSAELVESRNWAKTCDKTIHSLNDQLQDAKTKLKDLDAMHEKARDQDARIAELELMLQEQQSLSETTQSASSGEIDRLRERNAALVEELDKLRADALSDKAAAEAKIIELKAQYEKQLDELRVAMQSSLDAVTEREAEAQANFKSQLEHWTSRLKDQSKLDDDDVLARIKADYEEQLSALRARLEKDSEDAAEREKQAQENFKRLLGELDKRNKAKAKADLDAAEERLQQMQAEFETQMADLSQMQKKELAVLKFRHASALSLRDSRVEELEKLLLENETALEKSKSANTDDALASRRELSQLRAEYDELKARTAIESEDSSRLVRRLESEVESLRKQLASVEKAGDDTVMEMASQRASMKWESFCRGVLLRQHHRRFTTIAFGHAKAQLRDMLSIKEDAQKEARALQSQLDDALTRLEKMRETTNQLIASQKEANAKEVEAAQSKLKAAEAELDRLRKDNDAGKKALDVAQSKLKAAEAERDRLRKDNDAGKKALEAVQSKLEAAEAELDRLRKDNDAGKKALDVAQSKLKAAEAELGRLRGDLDISRSQGTADASALASAKSQRVQASWYRLCFAMRSRQHHLRTMETAKSFASSLKLELKMHGQTATAAIHRLQEEIAALKLQPAAQSPTEDQNTNEELASLRASALVYSEERAKYEEKISVLQGKLADLKAQLSAVPGLKSTMADLERDCKELRSENKRLSDELRALQSKLEDSERVRSRPTTEANSELVKSLKLRVTQLEQEVATMERKHAATTSHMIEDHKQEIAKLQKERDSAARDYSRIIEDLEGDLAEMTASRDVAIADMMKLRLRLDDLERSTISPTGTSDDVEQSMKELHVLRTKVEHLETELATERAKRQREAQSLSDKLAARDRDLSAANNALASSSDDAERTIKELNDKIRSQTTLVQRLEVQITELRVECDSMKIQLGHETDEASSRSAELVRSSRQFSDENAKLSAELQEALAELERLRVAKDFITKEFNFFQIESTQNAELIQRKLERTQEQLNDAEVEVAKLRAQVQEYAAEQEELMLEGQRIQRASDAKITKLRSQLTSVRVEYEEDLRTQVATLQEQMDDLTEELNDERAKSARALAQAKSESVDQGTVSVQRITVSKRSSPRPTRTLKLSKKKSRRTKKRWNMQRTGPR
jgi:chromosome segregation ATPase